MSKLSEWATKEKKADVPHFYFNEGMEKTIEFDETMPPVEVRQENGKEYANFRVKVDGKKYVWGIRKDTDIYGLVIKYLSADKYTLHISRAGNGLSVNPA